MYKNEIKAGVSNNAMNDTESDIKKWNEYYIQFVLKYLAINTKRHS